MHSAKELPRELDPEPPPNPRDGTERLPDDDARLFRIPPVVAREVETDVTPSASGQRFFLVSEVSKDRVVSTAPSLCPAHQLEEQVPLVTYRLRIGRELEPVSLDQATTECHVPRRNEEEPDRVLSVATGPTDFLVVRLDRTRRREVDDGLARLWQVMNDCIERGMAAEGILPGGLKVRRRAKGIRDALEAERGLNLTAPHTINDWMSLYAMAVNEENAAGGQVVTAPTNGAAGVVPAVLRYWLDHVPGASTAKIGDFLLTAAAIGGIVKHNASISGAECGCQAEVGSAAAMAAAAICAVMGGTPEQVENAAEIALEHHLGMTCDPVKGLVQVPCIERNGLGAIKAVSAASLALRGDGQHFVPLDSAIETMRQTGHDMHEKYKETSLGGLAVNVPNC